MRLAGVPPMLSERMVLCKMCIRDSFEVAFTVEVVGKSPDGHAMGHRCIVYPNGRFIFIFRHYGAIHDVGVWVWPVKNQQFFVVFCTSFHHILKRIDVGIIAVSYTHLDVYKRQTMSKYSTTIQSNDTLIWLLIPSEKETPTVKAKILTQDETKMSLEVKMKGKTWQLTIPYVDSRGASIK